MYDDLAACYHLIFENWDASIARQAAILGPQTIGLAMRGHAVTGSDLSAPAVARARVETAARHLNVPLCTADLRDLSSVPGDSFDAVLIADNTIAHLPGEEDLRQAAAAAARKLRSGGILIATMRDYDALVHGRPTVHDAPLYHARNAVGMGLPSLHVAVSCSPAGNDHGGAGSGGIRWHTLGGAGG